MKAIDLGLSVMWGDCNLGANTVTDDGSLFEWTELNQAKTILKKGWSIPDKAQMNELVQKCTKEFVNVCGKRMLMFTGPNGNSIFLPAAGCADKAGNRVEGGFYWTSTPVDEVYGCAYQMRFTDQNVHQGYNRIRIMESVRPIYITPKSQNRTKANDLRKIRLRSLLDDVDVYCASTKNAVYVQRVREKDYFVPEVRNWKHAFEGKPIAVVCAEIAKVARKCNADYKWDEYDVDGFCWNIGVFSLICESAGIVPSFDVAFKAAYKSYIEKGLNE